MSSLSGAGAGGGGGAGDGGGGGGASGHRDPVAAATSDAPGGGGRVEVAGGGQGAAGVGVGGGGGGGVGVGGGGGDRDVPGRHPLQAAITDTIFPVERRIEAYDGENEELDNLEALLSVPEEPPYLQRDMEEPITVTDQVLVGPNENQLGPNDLQACLRQGEWNHALDILTQMVRDGKDVAAAVSNDALPVDITRAHPELVVLLRGQALFDLRGMGNASRADAYYRNNICGIYPDDSTGIELVDNLLAEIEAMVQGEQQPRDVEVEDGVIRIGLFGEKQGKMVRCLACHDFKKNNYSEKKLYYHQLQDPEGRQARCPASTVYIREKIRDVLPKKEAAAATLHSHPDGPQGP